MGLNEITEVCNKQLCEPFLLFIGCYCLSLIKFNPVLKKHQQKIQKSITKAKNKTKKKNPPNFHYHQYQLGTNDFQIYMTSC